MTNWKDNEDAGDLTMTNAADASEFAPVDTCEVCFECDAVTVIGGVDMCEYCFEDDMDSSFDPSQNYDEWDMEY